MPSRYAAVVARQPVSLERTAAPPGVDALAFVMAMLEDVVEVVSDLAGVLPALVRSPPAWFDAGGLVWPGTPVIDLRPDEAPAATGALAGLAALGATEGVLVARDAPDLPQLLLGKLFSALSGADVAVCPARGGGLVALASRLPAPAWLSDTAVSVDTSDAVERLRLGAPARRSLVVGPGWGRLRRPTDVSALDMGLEGWDRTRTLLSGPAVRR
ncbi:MAG: hypothetical protein M3Z02_09110 [Actinomycetota bacterium]|nr:hypothetical protein [Actinomycetota bacterium]